MSEVQRPTARGQRVVWFAGGPEMVVRSFVTAPDAIPMAMCAWFTEDAHFHLIGFPVDELILQHGSSPPPGWPQPAG
jgi:uncharacterized protein YodC (DUF2158 family)